MKTKTHLSWLACALVAQVATGALAQPSSSGSAATVGPEGAQAAGFRCGGVGQEDQDRMKAEAPRHALMLTFATTDGAYVADVDVEIRKGGKVVLQGRCTGPLMLVDLAPAGSYEVSATAQGKTQHKTVSIGSKPASSTFTWPAS
jgi:hypothetical protein